MEGSSTEESQLMQAQAQHYASSQQSPMDTYNSSISLLTSPDSQLFELELALRNMQEGDDQTLIEMGEPLLNELGISRILGIVKTRVSRTAIFNSLDEKEIEANIKYLHDKLWEILPLRKREFDIKDSVDVSIISDLVVSICYMIFKRGEAEGERKFWSKITHEMISKNNSEKKQGLFARMNPFTTKT